MERHKNLFRPNFSLQIIKVFTKTTLAQFNMAGGDKKKGARTTTSAANASEFHDRLNAATVCYIWGTIKLVHGSVEVRVQRDIGVKRVYNSIVSTGWSIDSVITVAELPLDQKEVTHPRGDKPDGIELLKDIYPGAGSGKENHAVVHEEDEAMTAYRRFVVVDGWHRSGALELLLKEGRLITVKFRVVNQDKLNIHIAALMLNGTTATVNKTTFIDFITGTTKFRPGFEAWLKKLREDIEHGKVRWQYSGKPKNNSTTFAKYLVHVQKINWEPETISVYYGVAKGLKSAALEWVKSKSGGTDEVRYT